MPRVVFLPGCWYLDSLPSGEYAGIIPTERVVHTHQGLTPYPDDEPLWLVLTNQPFLRFMGQGHGTPFTYEWVEGRGWDTEPPACGVWALIYDAQGQPHIAKCAPPTGSQGWRYVAPDGTLVTGDVTLALLHGLLEWTDLSLAQDRTLLVGQGHDAGGVRVWADNQLRLLHPGGCFNIRAKYNPALDRVSISFYEVAADGLCGWVYWMSLAELRGLPPADVAGPPTHQPPDLPPPVPEPPPRVPAPPDPVPPHHPGPAPSPAPPKERPMKNKDQVRADINELIRFYNEPDGLNRRARGIPSPVVFNDPAITDWFTLAVMQDVEDIKRQIRAHPGGEWQQQHPGEAPLPNPR